MGIKAPQKGVAASAAATATATRPAHQPESATEDAPPNFTEASWAVVRSMVPNFDTAIVPHINANNGYGSPELLAFFRTTPQGDRRNYRSLLEDAVISRDPVTAADIYNLFLATQAPQAKPDGRPQRPIAVGTTGTARAAGTGTKPTYSRQDAEAFYTDYQGRIGSMTPEEREKAEKISAEYELAAAEGRLI